MFYAHWITKKQRIMTIMLFWSSSGWKWEKILVQMESSGTQRIGLKNMFIQLGNQRLYN